MSSTGQVDIRSNSGVHSDSSSAEVFERTHPLPVEDAAVLWDGAPHEPLATLTIAPQDAYSPARRVYGDDVLSFNPWNAVEAHQPLGSIMRVRKFAYESSTRFRHEANATPRLEPTSIDQIPD